MSKCNEPLPIQANMNDSTVQQMTCTRLPTPEGEFQLCLYRSSYDHKDHLVLITGDAVQQENVMARIHSECFTGDVLGSLRCDCGAQLHRSMKLIAHEGTGIILYLRQEGRGIGLLDKLRAYNLQDEGYDTVDANLELGHQADARDYTVAALILRDLGVRSVRLLTNNPDKVEALERLGVNVTKRISLPPDITPENIAYLQTKVKRMRHLLSLDAAQTLLTPNGQYDDPAWVAKETARIKRPANRPLVTLSYAQSLDGSISAVRGKPLAISGEESLLLTHQLRAYHDAILIGIGTALADDPQLTVRLAAGRDPQPIILDSRLRFPLTARMLQNVERRPWIVTTAQANQQRRRQLEDAGARIIELPHNSHNQIDLASLLSYLHRSGIKSLMVEGGARVITSFLTERLVDRLVLTIAPILVGGLNAVNQLSATFPHLRRPFYQRFGDDLVLFGDVAWDEE